jgi:hypothetical protein
MNMTNIFVTLAKLVRAGFTHLATTVFLLLALALNAQAKTYVYGSQVVTIKTFTKTVKRICDKVTYTLHIDIVTDGGPTNVIISDIWPNGLSPGGSITFTGNTSSAPSTNANSSGWSAQFDTPLGAGVVTSAYDVSFTSIIDPASLTGGDFKMTNQARVAVGPKSSPDYERSDDPSQPGANDKTVIDIPVADIKKCKGNSDQTTDSGTGSSSGACFTADQKIECGKVPGTFVVTLNAAGGSSTPDEVEVNVLTPGVTIQNPQSTYLVNSSGQVQLTLVGAAPGSTVELDISGSKLDPKSADGMSICCAGKIKVTIPKDLDCVKKVIDVAILKEGKTSPAPEANGYVFNLTATNEGGAYTPAAGSLKITDTVPAGMTFTGITASPGWSCLPAAPIAAGGTLTCTYTGGALPAGPGANIGGVQITATANGQGPYPPFKNCAVIGQASTGVLSETTLANNKSCVVVKKPDGKSTVSIEKKCGPVKNSKYPVGPAATAAGFNTSCTITVTTTGPQSGAMTVNDAMVGGTAVWMSSTSTPTWACSGTSCNINSSTLNQTSSVSTFNVVVAFPNAASVKEAKNCARIASPVANAESCVPFSLGEGQLTVVKEAFVNGTRYTTQAFPTKVICDGNIVTTSIQDGASPYVQTGLAIGTNCKVEEGNGIATPPGLCKEGSVAAWNVSYSPAQTVVMNGTNQVVTVKNELVCNPPPPVGTVDVTKVCDPPEPIDGPIKGALGSKCQITVTTLGPQTGTITVSDSLTGAGTLGNATAPAPWTCSGAGCSVAGASLNQTSSTTVINVPVTFANAGNAAEAKNCPVIKGQEIDPKDCVTFEAKTGTLTIAKEVYYKGQRATPSPVPGLVFPISVTCGGNTSNGTIQDGAAPYVRTNIPLGTTCTVVEGAPPALKICKKDEKQSWQTTYLPSASTNIVAGGSTITVRNEVFCEKINPVDSKLYIKKVVVNNAPGSVAGMVFTIKNTCTNAPTTSGLDSLTDGQTKPYMTYVPNTSCTVQELAIPATNACGSGMTPKWTTTYAPSQTVPLVPAGVTITVTNQLDCEDVKVKNLTTFSVRKEATYNGEQITNYNFPMTVTCGNGLAEQIVLTGGQGKTYDNLPDGTTCKVVEGNFGNTGLCPKGTTEQWSKSYVPANGEKTTTTQASVIVTVRNRLECKPIIIIKTPKCDPQTAKLVGKECACTIRGMVLVSTTRCECPKGQRVINGRCGVPPPVCGRGEKLVNGECVVIRPDCQRGERYNPKTNRCDVVRPDCQRGERYNPKTNRCDVVRPDCQRGERYNPKTNRCDVVRPDCQRGERYNPKTNRCDVVRPDCQRGERYNPKRNRCEQVRPECQRGERYNPKRNRCEEVVQKQRCPRGFIATELGCINPRKALDIFRDITRDDDKPRGGGDCKNADGFPVPC